MVSIAVVAALLGASRMQGVRAAPQGGIIIATTTTTNSEPTMLPGHEVCVATPLPTTTIAGHKFNCLRFECPQPTATCGPSQLPKPPRPTTTFSQDCTVTVSAAEECACPTCAV